MSFALTPEREEQLERILSRYPNPQAACIPVLHLCQEQLGWISEDVARWVAERLGLSAAQVYGVATFYHLFNQKPVGRHRIWVCRTLSCALRGGEELVRHCEARLGIHCGETTADGLITLRTAECLASCGTAPMMQVDRDYHENLTIARVDAILDGLRNDGLGNDGLGNDGLGNDGLGNDGLGNDSLGEAAGGARAAIGKPGRKPSAAAHDEDR